MGEGDGERDTYLAITKLVPLLLVAKYRNLPVSNREGSNTSGSVKYSGSLHNTVMSNWQLI